jgi:hypothetical protein
MLTGVPPYQGDNFMEILTKKATLDPVPPMQLRSSIPDAVSELVMRAMARNPDDRPPSMEAFEYEILKCLAGRGAAVAQILGMTTDANLVAHLNPGISVRHFEGGVMTRAATSPVAPVSAMMGPPAVVTPSSGNLASPAASALRAVNRLGSPPGALERGGIDGVSPPNGIASGGDFSATAVVDSIPVGQVVAVRGSRAAMVGWLVLAALLFGGVGVVLYVAAGERAGKQAREQAALAAAAATKAADGELVEPAVAADRAAAAPRPDGDGKDRRDPDKIEKTDAKPVKADAKPDAKPEKADAKPDKADARPEKTDPKPDKADARRADARKKGDGPPTSEKEAKQLLAEAKNQVARMDYPGARDTYARIADSKFFRGQGLLGMAKVAWETRDVDGAITLAQQALKAGAGDPARTLLGHAYFKKNDYARALQYYEAVLANRPNDPEVKRSVEALRARMGGM